MKFIFIFLILLSQSLWSDEAFLHKDFNLDLENVSLQKAIYTIAKFNHRNILISPNVKGLITIHLEKMTSDAAFDFLLTSKNLVKLKIGESWYIAPEREIIKRQEDHIQFIQLHENMVPLINQTIQIHYAKAKDIVHTLLENSASLISKRGHIALDERTNSICIQEIQSNLANIKKIIRHLDVPVNQVVIEARLVSIDRDGECKLGIQFASNNNCEVSHSPNQCNLAIARFCDGSTLDLILSALEKEGRSEVISSPRLFTTSQQAASIEAGEEIPYQEISKSGATSVSFKKAVLSLKVTPQVMPHQLILLELQINQDRPNARMVLGVPAISTRQINTNVLVKSGETIILGGIYEENSENNQLSVPFFGKIPLFGLLFQHQNTITNKRELLIFVTPKIMSK